MAAPDLAERLQSVRGTIADAAAQAGRSDADITTIVVTKFQSASLITKLAELGVCDFGESRHQEAAAKAGELGRLTLTWHFIGQLQSKKAKAVRQYAQVVHSVDRDSLVTALSDPEDEASDALDVFVQLNLDRARTAGAGRGGVQDSELEPLVERVLAAPGLNLLGLMGVAPLGEEPRAAFARLRAASERIMSLAPQAGKISAGMSGDYPAAIAEGATHLRIGTAITGNRPDAG